jgi:hypothetical protein
MYTTNNKKQNVGPSPAKRHHEEWLIENSRIGGKRLAPKLFEAIDRGAIP